MPKQAMLRVFANPFAAIDHEGRPCGHLQYEPDLVNGDASLRFVGCFCKSQLVRKADPKNGIRERHDHSFEYSAEPTNVPATAYYLAALRCHDLLPADEATHAAVFGSPAGFVCPKARMAQFAAERGAKPALVGGEDFDAFASAHKVEG